MVVNGGKYVFGTVIDGLVVGKLLVVYVGLGVVKVYLEVLCVLGVVGEYILLVVYVGLGVVKVYLEVLWVLNVDGEYGLSVLVVNGGK